MRFRVGPWRYSLRVSATRLMHEGKPCFGLCIADDREILLSPTCKPRERLPVLLHELTHAWIFSCGMPHNLEGWCDLNGTIFATAMQDFSIQGGIESLLRMQPGESASWKANTVSLATGRACGKCRSSIAGASVICNQSDVAGALDLSIYCEHCGHVQKWRETATINGLPSATVIGRPTFERGPAVVEFLRAFPEAAPDVVMV